jgi:hypothetical protein
MATNDKQREERLAAALRENLRRRKAQAREAKVQATPKKTDSESPIGAQACCSQASSAP